MAPHTFTNETYVELLLLYFRNGENQSKASQLYAELHPDQPAPSHKVVGRLIRRFLATGSVQEIKHGRPKSATAENNTIEHSGQWAAQQIEQDPQFYKKIIFTDKSTFVRHGQISRHRTYHWSKTNLHNFAHAYSQHIEKLNAIWDDVVIGPFFINGNLTGERYRSLLNNQVFKFF
uniref:DUF4817 domain-containing protein n=1 Tax=Strigamia maritima TaxID=126957 RepID=T1JKS9_STRMM